MLNDLLQRFDALPSAVREPVSSAQAVKALEQIELKFNVNLGIIAIRVMVKDIPLDKLPIVLENELGQPASRARLLAADLKNNFFSLVLHYLETTSPPLTAQMVTPSQPSGVGAVRTEVPTIPSRLLNMDITKQNEEWKKQNISGARIFDLLFNAIQQKDQKIILAALNALAESGELLNILKTDSRFYYLLANYYRHQKRLNDLKEFHMLFGDPKYVKELVRYILGEQLKLLEDEAAHIGVDLVNLMREKEVKIKHWSYFDMKTSTYKWL